MRSSRIRAGGGNHRDRNLMRTPQLHFDDFHSRFFSSLFFSGLTFESLNCRHVVNLRIVGVLLYLEPCSSHGMSVFNCGFHAILYQMVLLRSGEAEHRELPSP
jgi:hypothetical protein